MILIMSESMSIFRPTFIIKLSKSFFQWVKIHAGVEHVAGDMLNKVPTGDAILIKVISLSSTPSLF